MPQITYNDFMRSKKTLVFVLIVIVLYGAFFRFYAVNWDSFGAYHPDERNISWAITRIKFFSQMDPKFFAYGGLPIYLYRALGEAVIRITHDPNWLFDWGHIAIVGRYVSAVLSTISIGLVFLVGAAYFSPVVGVLSAVLLAFSPWAIREAHFETTETMLVFFSLLLLFFSKKIQKKKGVILLGVIWGLSMAAKTTALLFGLIPAAAIWLPNVLKNIRKKLQFSFLLCTVTALFFFTFSPFTVLDFIHFKESMMYESGVALGRFTVPYTLQFLHSIPYLYQLVTMIWQAGPLVIVGVAGLTVMLIAVILSLSKDLHKTKTIVFLIFPLVYFGWTGTWFAKFARYNVPFLPFVTIAAAWLCDAFIKRYRRAGLAFTVLLLSLTCLWGLANFTIYMRPQTKITATDWIVNHIPTSALIYSEHWNDGLPLDLPDVPKYNRELLNVYDDPDNNDKRIYYADKLSAADYIIFSTRRIWATMPNLLQRYPVTSPFYKKLLAGQLGYTEVATFTSYPQLFGIEINDDTAEESVQVFDHPTVRIFENTSHLTKNALYSILGGK
jgi:hypothetical protein